MTLHIVGSRHTGDEFGPRYRVLIDGQVYSNVNRFVLASLEDGYSPEDLGMEPDDDEPEEWWPGSPDEDSSTLTPLRGWR